MAMADRTSRLLVISEALAKMDPEIVHMIIEDLGYPSQAGEKSNKPDEYLIAQLRTAGDQGVARVEAKIDFFRRLLRLEERTKRDRLRRERDGLRRLERLVGKDPEPGSPIEGVLLNRSQKVLLRALGDAGRLLPKDAGTPFKATRPKEGPAHIEHPGLPGWRILASPASRNRLVKEGLLVVTESRPDGAVTGLDITPKGHLYYRWLLEHEGDLTARMEAETRGRLESSGFNARYPAAVAKWWKAEDLLWSAHSEEQATAIGRLCREALQEFATALVETFNPPGVDTNKAHDSARIKAVLSGARLHLGENPWLKFRGLDGLLRDWDILSGHARQQEHGSNSGQPPRVWRDARNLVMWAVEEMFGVDEALRQVT